ncbi:hypothetical protein KIL84_010739 [Mauremys mutica]|uniref:Uncharacterized protein n=1 Tax=Mauremys mutica TaxID=74926 RepID=A0A9D3XBN9_9SAUR|nr:hypothetical protein KIL84_010739 [Mauremys mutica]
MDVLLIIEGVIQSSVNIHTVQVESGGEIRMCIWCKTHLYTPPTLGLVCTAGPPLEHPACMAASVLSPGKSCANVSTSPSGHSAIFTPSQGIMLLSSASPLLSLLPLPCNHEEITRNQAREHWKQKTCPVYMVRNLQDS